MIEKGKGSSLGKLRAIELIEGDLELLTRIFVGLRNDESTKNNNILSTFNFRFRKQHSIESMLLENLLICYTSKCNNEPIMHLLLDLESCYD